MSDGLLEEEDYEILLRKREELKRKLQEYEELEDGECVSDNEVPQTPCKTPRLNDSFQEMNRMLEQHEDNISNTNSYFRRKQVNYFVQTPFVELNTPNGKLKENEMEPSCLRETDEDLVNMPMLPTMTSTPQPTMECEEAPERLLAEANGNRRCPFSHQRGNPLESAQGDYFDEIEEMLEQPLNESHDMPTQTKLWKRVLDRLDTDYFNSLPDGWTRVTHNSGMPVYMHKATRVVTLSRPYCVGEHALRGHHIPLSAIPCLHRKRLDEQEAKAREEKERQRQAESQDQGNGHAAGNGHANETTVAKIPELANVPSVTLEKQENYTLNAEQFADYCSRLFKFKKILVTRYKNTAEKYKARNERKLGVVLAKAGVRCSVDEVLKQTEGGTLPQLMLLNIPVADSRFNRKNFFMNPTGKSTVMILNEYVQRAMKGKVEYTVDNTRNVTCPYRAGVTLVIRKALRVQMAGTLREKLALIQEKNALSETAPDTSANSVPITAEEEKFVLGYGQGASKKSAKLAAAKEAIALLIPNLKINDDFMVDLEGDIDGGESANRNYDEQTMEIFDEIKIEDARVSDLCTKTGHPKPLALLKDAIAKSIRWNGQQLIRTNTSVGAQRTKVVLKLAEIETECEAIGGKAAVQIAAQLMLKKMHQEFENYGSLLRLYASVTEKSNRMDARKQHDEVVRLQNKGDLAMPNVAVVKMLKGEMHRTLRSPITRPEYGPFGSNADYIRS